MIAKRMDASLNLFFLLVFFFFVFFLHLAPNNNNCWIKNGRRSLSAWFICAKFEFLPHLNIKKNHFETSKHYFWGGDFNLNDHLRYTYMYICVYIKPFFWPIKLKAFEKRAQKKKKSFARIQESQSFYCLKILNVLKYLKR